MKVSILDVLSLGVRGGVPEGDGDHGDNIRLKANMISFVVTVWSPLSPSGPPRARHFAPEETILVMRSSRILFFHLVLKNFGWKPTESGAVLRIYKRK